MSLLKAFGGLVGLALGGPMGAALGSGIGTLAGGGNLEDAFKAGALGYAGGSLFGSQLLGGMSSVATGIGASGLGQTLAAQQASMLTNPNALQALAGKGFSTATAPASSAAPMATIGAQQTSQGVMGLMNNPLVLGALLEASEPKVPELTPEQQRQIATGERTTYTGTAAPGTPSLQYNYAAPRNMGMAQGGYISGPGTGKSDSIPAAIYQDGGRVQEARLSDGEFVMTADAVKGAGGGNRSKGAAEMYRMMNQFERMA